MKITSVKEVDVKDVAIEVHVNLKTQKASITMSYTCPDCAGWGCRSHGNTSGGNPDCNGGSIEVKINPAKIDQQLDAETALKLRATIQNLFEEMTD